MNDGMSCVRLGSSDYTKESSCLVLFILRCHSEYSLVDGIVY